MDAHAPKPFPWRRVLHVGLCLLRLPPETFWAMTPIEFHAMAGGLSPRAARLDRQVLRAMMERFPDR
ncbi:rcc01693 family protein [Rhizobium sp. BK376]|uniref:rcc01693 family protein n=1 Tax=Rhizobium sp. BK376 TaxID=2512149 RepID=UPI001049BE82|nr:rcc01693 family protein [Rhizobium sp. BK376]